MINNFEKNNEVIVKGKAASEPVFSHAVMGEGFYEFPLLVPRLSSEVDILPITISERLLPEIKNLNGEIALVGQLRSYNKLEGDKSRLILTIFAREIIDPENVSTSNQITMIGYVCKEPIYRTTPFGREITDILIAVNRAYNKSDYLPCIAWGRNARFAGDLHVGDKLMVTGRIQSRTYQKRLSEDNIVNKTAYEVSISSLSTEFEVDEEYADDEYPEASKKGYGEMPSFKENDNVDSASI